LRDLYGLAFDFSEESPIKIDFNKNLWIGDIIILSWRHHIMENFEKELSRIRKKLEIIHAELKTLPEGRLIRRGNAYSQVIEKKEIGITGNERLIRQLSRKKCLLKMEKKLKHNFAVLTGRSQKLVSVKSREIIDELSNTYQDLPIDYFYHPSISEFLSKSHSGNTYKQENRNFETKNGVLVRSKSEYIIATELESLDVPYQYEMPLQVKGKTIYPDFIIRNPFTGKKIIWEHFGALHESGYESNMTQKMKDYLAVGYQPFDTLIYTFEFDTLTPGRIKSLIQNTCLQE